MRTCEAEEGGDSGKRYLFLLVAIILANLFFSVIGLPYNVDAKENASAIWFFGDGVGLDFRDNPPALLTENISFSSEGSAVISDADGNLLFYTDGIQVWDREHSPMPHGSGLHGGPFAPQSALIAPNPANPDLYYLFTVSDDSGLQYAVVDITANNALGDVVQKNIQLWRPTAEKITAVRHQNEKDVWIIVTGLDDNSFYAYLVSESGINPTPVISKAGIGHTTCEFDRSGFLKASPGGKKLALSVFEAGFFEVFDFDNATGVVSNPLFLGDYESAYGIEFSPDDTKLYATVVSWVHNEIYQFDLEAVSIPGSVQVIGETTEEARFRALQVASDGRIYVARDNSFYLGVIEFPNKPGAASQYIDKGVFLEGRQCWKGLPNFVQSFFTPPIITLAIHDTQATEDELVAIFRVELSETSRSEISVMYDTQDGTAIAKNDYRKTTGILRIPEGANSGTIRVNIVDDDEFDESPETVVVTLSNPRRAVLGDDSAVGTIWDNDLVGLSIDDAIAEEGNGALVFTAALSQASRSEVSVEYATSDDTALAGDEYQAITGTITIPAGERAGTIRVPLYDDEVDEADTTMLLQLSNPLNADLLTTQAQGTIRDDDDPPLITIDDAVLVEQTGTMSFTVRLSQVSKRDVQVAYATRNDAAMAGSDYTDTSGTILIPAGLRVGTIMVDIADDELHEAQERFLLTLNEPIHATLLDSEGVGIIQDNDDPPMLSIRKMAADEDTEAMNFLATLSTVSGRDVSFQYAVQDGTATAGQDYAAISGIFTIPAGSQAAMLTVPVYDDDNDEQDEDFFLLMSQPQHAILADSRVAGTIRDDDAPPSIGITDVAAGEDAESVDFTISLSGTSYQDVSVHVVTTDGTATIAGNDYLLRPDTEIVIPAGHTEYTFSVRINEDRRIEGEEYFFVQVHDPVNGSLLDEQGQATIYDNDALPEIALSEGIVDENAGTVTFIVSLSEKSALPVIVNYTARDETTTKVEDNVVVEGTLAIVPENLSGEIVVPCSFDEFPEKPPNIRVLLSELHNALFAAP